MRKPWWRRPLILALLAPVCAGCGHLGKVNQGRVVSYDADNGIVTLIGDSNPADPANPRYDVLPPALVRVPSDRSSMGPVPEPGLLLSVDNGKKQLVVFDPGAQTLKAIPFHLVHRQTKVSKSDLRISGRKFPVVEGSSHTITIYLRRQREIIVFSVPEAYLALPESTWRFGDEVRYYYKQPSQALRMMNVTKTDIF